MKRMTWLLVLALVVGCSAHKDHQQKSGEKGKTEPDDHDHGPGPHKGLVVDFEKNKEGAHFEFVMNHAKKEVRVYILDRKAKDELPIKAERMTLTINKPKFTLELKPNKVDANGKTSCFVGTDDRFGVEQDFAGTVTVIVEGTPWTGEFDEKDLKH